MSTNTLLKVEGTAWSVSKDIEEALKGKTESADIITSLGLDYTVSAHHVKTDIEEPVPGFYGMYRDDTEKFLGIVKSNEPAITQNVDSFKSIEPLMEDGTLRPLVADSYLGGKQVFGCFEVADSFKVLDDTFRHYFIVVNDHLRPDGTVTVINTPVRIACMNAMSSALSRSTLKFKIPAVVTAGNKGTISSTIKDAYERSIKMMRSAAEKMTQMQISKVGVEKLLDELFPYIEETEEGTTNHDRANQAVAMQREAFLTCLAADDLANYQGTMYGVFNALTDYSQHMHRNSDKAFDLGYRMTLLPGMNPEATTEALKVSKFLKNMKSFERSRKVAVAR